MTEFEYLAVLVSIVLGLGVTHLLAGVGRMIHRREVDTIDPLHAMWTASTFWVLILNWWVFFQAQSFDTWSFELFIVVILWSVSYFMLAMILFPPDLKDGEAYGQIFEKNRKWFLSIFVVASLVDVLLTSMRGDLFDPPAYLPFVLHFVGLGLLGIFVFDVRLNEGDFTTSVLGLNGSYSFSPRVYLQANIQYNDDTEDMGTNIRFGWLDTAGTGLLISYNDAEHLGDLLTTGFGRGPRARQLVIKYSKLLEFSR